jgi:hypothetical protein
MDRDDLAILFQAKEIPAQSRGICVTPFSCVERPLKTPVSTLAWRCFGTAKNGRSRSKKLATAAT